MINMKTWLSICKLLNRKPLENVVTRVNFVRFQSTLWNTEIGTTKLREEHRHHFDDPVEVKITSDGEPTSPNDKYCTEFVNRNPRNLERMHYAMKPSGWAIDSRKINYWHKATIVKRSNCVQAKLTHFSGKEVVSASSAEWAIKKYLYSATDASAVENVSIVFARRCLESGICHVHTSFTDKELESSKIKTFLRVLEEEGIASKEPNELVTPRPFSFIRIPKPPHYKD